MVVSSSRGAASLLILSVAACSTGESREAALVREVRALVDDPALRPAHVTPPTPGRFADLAAPWWAAVHQRYVEVQAATPQAAASGALPLVTPPEGLDAFAEARAAAAQIRAASRATSGRLPESLLASSLGADELPNYIDVQLVVQLGRIDADALLREGRADEAVAPCVDALALARDLGGASIIGSMIAVSVTIIVAPACLATARSASPEARARMIASLRIIRAGWPSFATALERDRVFIALVTTPLSEEARAALPPLARTTNLQTTQDDPGLVMAIVGGALARQYREASEAAAAAMALPVAAADARLAELSAPTWLATLVSLGEASVERRLVGYARRARAGRAHLELVLAAAVLWQRRAEDGRWPASWAEAGVEPPVDPRTELPFALELRDDGAAITPVDDGERTELDLAIVLR